MRRAANLSKIRLQQPDHASAGSPIKPAGEFQFSVYTGYSRATALPYWCHRSIPKCPYLGPPATPRSPPPPKSIIVKHALGRAAQVAVRLGERCSRQFRQRPPPDGASVASARVVLIQKIAPGVIIIAQTPRVDRLHIVQLSIFRCRSGLKFPRCATVVYRKPINQPC